MDLQCPIDPTAFSTPLQWRRVDRELLVSGEIDESSNHYFAEALDSFTRVSTEAPERATHRGVAEPRTNGHPVADGPITGPDDPMANRSLQRWLVDLRSTRLLAAAGVTTLLRWLRSLEEGDQPPPEVVIVPSANVKWVLDTCRLGDAVPFCRVDPWPAAATDAAAA